MYNDQPGFLFIASESQPALQPNLLAPPAVCEQLMTSLRLQRQQQRQLGLIRAENARLRALSVQQKTTIVKCRLQLKAAKIAAQYYRNRYRELEARNAVPSTYLYIFFCSTS